MSVPPAEKFDGLGWIFHFYQRFYDLPMRRELL